MIRKSTLLGGIALSLGNILMMMPNEWTFLQFNCLPVTIGPLVVECDAHDPTKLVIEAQLFPILPGNSTFPLPFIEHYIRRRQCEHVVDNGYAIVITAPASQPLSQSEYDQASGRWRHVIAPAAMTTSYPLPGVWRPVARSPLRFHLSNTLNLLPGEYVSEVRVMAHPPWKIPAAWTDDQLKVLLRPHWPGSVLWEDASSHPIEYSIFRSE